jgi:biopolymer transport protein ExbB
LKRYFIGAWKNLLVAALAAVFLCGEASAGPAPPAPPGGAVAPDAAPSGRKMLKQPESAPFSVGEAIAYLKEQWRAGGITMWFLLFLSILGLAFVLERAARLRRVNIVPVGLAEKADALWRAGKFSEIEALCATHKTRGLMFWKERRPQEDGGNPGRSAPQRQGEEQPSEDEELSTLAKILRFAVRHRDYPAADVSAAAGDIAARDIGYHQMLAFPIAAVAGLAPLLGLFGTVIGMMDSFRTVALAGEMGDPTLLASGISKALVTTAFGLSIAIPALFFYNVFRFRTNHLAKLLEEKATTLLSEWLLKPARAGLAAVEGNQIKKQTGAEGR